MNNLREKKLSVIEAILSLDDDIILDEILGRLQKPFPCQFTPEEKRQQLENGDKQQQAGQYTPAEEVMNRYKHLHS